MEIIKSTKAAETGCLLHCYSGEVELAREYVKMGCYLSIPGTVTFKNNRKTVEVVRAAETGCLLHCYSGEVELAREYVKMGCYLSIPGTVTFKNNRKTVEVVREIPLERLMIETDSPYMAPVPHRGKRNDPSLVTFVAEKIAYEKGISYEEVCRVTKENAMKFFGMAPVPHRGKRNDPSLVTFVAEKIAYEKGISYEEVCRVTKENAMKFFGIK